MTKLGETTMSKSDMVSPLCLLHLTFEGKLDLMFLPLGFAFMHSQLLMTGFTLHLMAFEDKTLSSLTEVSRWSCVAALAKSGKSKYVVVPKQRNSYRKTKMLPSRHGKTFLTYTATPTDFVR